MGNLQQFTMRRRRRRASKHSFSLPPSPEALFILGCTVSGNLRKSLEKLGKILAVVGSSDECKRRWSFFMASSTPEIHGLN